MNKKFIIIPMTGITAICLAATLTTTAIRKSAFGDTPECMHESVNHYSKEEPTEFKPGHIEYWVCCNCHESFKDQYCVEKLETLSSPLMKGDDRYLSPKQVTHSLLNSNVINYLSAQTETDQINALKVNTPYNNQVGKTITFKNTGNTPYVITVSNDKNFTSTKTYQTSSTTFTFEKTLTPGEIVYYNVKDSTGAYILDDCSFKVDDTYSVRTLDVSGVNNMRDIGGWTARGGNKVKYGMIYRGGTLAGITSTGKETLLSSLGVKNEIDLRTDGTSQLVDSRLNYNKCGMWQYTMVIPGYTSPGADDDPSVKRGFDYSSTVSIKKIMELLANPESYPIYYHCNAGADRTGTISYIINGLLGVSYEDLTRDFELTSYSTYGARHRSKDDGTKFDDSGIYHNTTGNLITWGKMNELMSTNYKQDSNELCSAIEFYLKKECKVKQETIDAVRRNLLGKDVSFPETEHLPDASKDFTFSNGNLTNDSVITITETEIAGQKCFKAEASIQSQIYNNIELINNPNNKTFSFDMYVPSGMPKLGGLGEMAIRTKNPDQYLDFNSSKATSGTTTHIELDKWGTYTVDISSYTSLNRFAFLLPAGSTIYFKNITLI